MKEIERKYLVSGDFYGCISKSISITQGYLSAHPERTVRIRLADDKAYLTIKGKRSGISRLEWEKEIDHKEAQELLELCGRIIRKTRHIIEYNNLIIEVDEFHGKDQGLVIAEIELDKESDLPELPDWLGKEVSYDKKYYNSWLSEHPFNKWNK